jgi:hypothetical protein
VKSSKQKDRSENFRVKKFGVKSSELLSLSLVVAQLAARQLVNIREKIGAKKSKLKR